ncbi:DNA-binding protein SMUBP-2-like [Brevipalpus obovatus]|uniref:DNA-binding protein SMUBP-2-like n=1 Tax=Brevipalpus obovatus TaxID=246614 RepID=UPI003D9F0D80
MAICKIENYIRPLLKAVDLEAEFSRDLANMDLSRVDNLTYDSCEYSELLFCKTLITFVHTHKGDGGFAFCVGDQVVINSDSHLTNPYLEPESQRCHIFSLDLEYVKLSMNGLPPAWILEKGKIFHLTRDPHDFQYERMKDALKTLKRRAKEDRLTDVIRLLLNISPEEEEPMKDAENIKRILHPSEYVRENFEKIVLSQHKQEFNFHPLFDETLDVFQRKAIEKSLTKDNTFTVIHGPPGTGKTSSLVEIIRQAHENGYRVLVTGASNPAVDNLVARLAEVGEKDIARLGQPARASQIAREYSLDKSLNDLLISKQEMEYIKRCMRKIEIDPMSRQHLNDKFNQLRSVRDDETAAILQKKSIVLGTMISASPLGQLKMMLKRPGFWFDLVIIDECSQAIEPMCWIVLPLAKRCILAGDHRQLPPVLRSREADRELGLTLMDKCVSLFKERVETLKIQYRMNEKLMEWPSNYFYQGKLEAHPEIKNISLTDISDFRQGVGSLLMIDTIGCNMHETKVFGHKSTANNFEANLVMLYLYYLLRHRVPPSRIGIITPYSLQRRLIERKISEVGFDVEVRSIDGFQGQERDVIILSMVRSNRKQTVGFLSSEQRINVAVTRARRHLAVIGDSSTFFAHSCLDDLARHIKAHGTVKRVRTNSQVVDFLKNCQIKDLRDVFFQRSYDSSDLDELEYKHVQKLEKEIFTDEIDTDPEASDQSMSDFSSDDEDPPRISQFGF